jgi:hypothetical protein
MSGPKCLVVMKGEITGERNRYRYETEIDNRKHTGRTTIEHTEALQEVARINQFDVVQRHAS